MSVENAPAPLMVETIIYLSLTPTVRSGRIRGMSAVARKTKPTGKQATPTIKLRLRIPEVVFEPFLAEVDLEVTEQQVDVAVYAEPVEIATSGEGR